MMIPLTPDDRTDATMPPPPSIVIDLVIVTAPKPPGSRASISPGDAVFEMAPAKVLQGAVRLHGLTSSPTPDTQVRVACAWANEANASIKAAITNILSVNRNLFIWSLLFFYRKLGMAASRTRISSGHCCCRIVPLLMTNRFSSSPLVLARPESVNARFRPHVRYRNLKFAT